MIRLGVLGGNDALHRVLCGYVNMRHQFACRAQAVNQAKDQAAKRKGQTGDWHRLSGGNRAELGAPSSPGRLVHRLDGDTSSNGDDGDDGIFADGPPGCSSGSSGGGGGQRVNQKNINFVQGVPARRARVLMKEEEEEETAITVASTGGELETRVYLLPVAHMDLSCHLAERDIWYRRQVFVPLNQPYLVAPALDTTSMARVNMFSEINTALQVRREEEKKSNGGSGGAGAPCLPYRGCAVACVVACVVNHVYTQKSFRINNRGVSPPMYTHICDVFPPFLLFSFSAVIRETPRAEHGSSFTGRDDDRTGAGGRAHKNEE